MALSNNIKVTA